MIPRDIKEAIECAHDLIKDTNASAELHDDDWRLLKEWIGKIRQHVSPEILSINNRENP